MAIMTEERRQYLITELETNKEMLALWREAERALTTGKEYQIGTRRLTRANANEVAQRITYYTREIAYLEEQIATGKRSRGRTYRVIPRDI